ncbi:hypothetical protein FNV43_RR08540 [Rhamnella rubrinervis]|uniref:Uncharacterized protein n=1 Tax=Rhamnella rubrinervis TaxID=2594499 RepID=A0A8K0H8Y9_9ROSA|nr:hypothetical protein FNV43_RR08540 [Rhamnella rubrinervis]
MASSPSLAFHVKRREPDIVVPVKATPWELNKLSDIDDQEGMRLLFPTKQSHCSDFTTTIVVFQCKGKTQLKEDPLAHLQHLPSLIHLEFLLVYEGESLHFKAGGFPSLKLLGLDKLEALQLVTMDYGVMPHLEKLVIQCCKSLSNVLAGIKYLMNLNVLEFLICWTS